MQLSVRTSLVGEAVSPRLRRNFTVVMKWHTLPVGSGKTVMPEVGLPQCVCMRGT